MKREERIKELENEIEKLKNTTDEELGIQKAAESLLESITYKEAEVETKETSVGAYAQGCVNSSSRGGF
ncbi:hypothetical protein EZS27_013644 [termite gut metagenome]|uniref:Uncharacterized protein n=1 Tax=termite gut metagenome TaxID=433724 RepID=A0A5J4RWM8_9ZZZZ